MSAICCDFNETLPEFDLTAEHKALTSGTMENTLPLDVTPCNFVVHRRFGGNTAFIFMIEEKAKSAKNKNTRLLPTSCWEIS
jgi:hypothetical protein